MSELNLPACPICHAEDNLTRETMERTGQAFTWYECQECGSVLLWAGGDLWTYQQVGREDKKHLLRQPLTSEELEQILLRIDAEPPPAAQESAQVELPPTDMTAADTRICPYCAETIKARAIVCRYCGRDLTSEPPPSPPTARRRFRWLWLIAFIAIAVLAIVFLVGREDASILPPRASEPGYIKDLVGYTEGSNGLVVYFVLADMAGEEVAAEGRVKLTVFDTDSEWDATKREFVDVEELLYSSQLSVTASDFQKTKVGLGAFERTRLVCTFGRIPFSRFSRQPQDHTGKIVLEFTPSGVSEVLEAEETIIW